MIARGAASLILAGALALGMTGCGFVVPQATLIHYAPSDGAQTNVGDIKVRNAIAISEDGKDASLVMTVINSGSSAITVDFQYTDATGTSITESVPVPARGSVSLGNAGEKQLVLSGIDVVLGSTIPVYVQYGKVGGAEILVPVLSPENSAEYDGLKPTPLPTPVETKTAAPVED